MLPLRAGRRMCGKDAAEGRDGAYSAKMPLKKRLKSVSAAPREELIVMTVRYTERLSAEWPVTDCRYSN